MLSRLDVHAFLLLACATSCASQARESSSPPVAAQEPRESAPSVQIKAGNDNYTAAPAEVVDAIAKHAIAIATVEPGNGLADLRGMREWLSSSRVVALGEAAPGTHELFQMNRRVLEVCVEEGFRVLASEVGWAEALAVNEYVLRGTGDPKVALEGLRVPAWNTEEALELVRWMRAWNADEKHSPKLEFEGLDIQFTRGAYLVALDYLQRVDPESAERMGIVLAAFRQVDDKGKPRYTSLDRDMRAASHAAVQDTLALLEDSKEIYLKKTNEAEWSVAKQAAIILSEAEEMYGADKSEDAAALREQALADNVGWILKRKSSDTRVVVWAANMHVRDEHEPMRRMGSHLREKFGDKVVLVGSTFGRGAAPSLVADASVKEPASSVVRFEPPPSVGVEATFARAKIPLAALRFAALPKGGPAATWFSSHRTMREMTKDSWGAQPPLVSVVPSSAYDALIFVDEVKPARSLQSSAPQNK